MYTFLIRVAVCLSSVLNIGECVDYYHNESIMHEFIYYHKDKWNFLTTVVLKKPDFYIYIIIYNMYLEQTFVDTTI